MSRAEAIRDGLPGSVSQGCSAPGIRKFDTLKDFEPEQVVNQVPELRKLLELRQALMALKGPLGNVPAFRKAIQGILDDEGAKSQLLAELGLDKDASE